MEEKTNVNEALVKNSSQPQIKIFNSPVFGEIRTIVIDNRTNETWFVLKEICDILGYANASKTKLDHLREKDITNRYPLCTNGGEQQTTLINENGLYRLIMRSKKENTECKHNLVWTEKGREFIHNQLIENNII